MDWKADLAQAEVECSALDFSYMRLRLAQIDCAAQMAMSTLPKSMRAPFREIISISQAAQQAMLDV